MLILHVRGIQCVENDQCKEIPYFRICTIRQVMVIDLPITFWFIATLLFAVLNTLDEFENLQVCL